LLLIAMFSDEKEPQINADERRLNASSFNIQDSIFEVNNIFSVPFGKNREWHRNMRRMIGFDQNQSGIKRKPLAIMNDKINATNLCLSAFICGLKKSQKTKQPDFILELENHRILFSNNTPEFKKVHLRWDFR